MRGIMLGKVAWAACVVGVCPAALAGPWPATEGGIGIAGVFLTDGGQAEPAAGIEAYGERQLGPGHSVVLSGWVDERDTGDEGRGELTLTVKRSSADRFGRAAFAIEAGPALRFTPDPGCAPAGAELRGSAGIGGLGREGAVFGTVELAIRPGFGGCSAVRNEISVGYWREPGRTLWLAQAFIDHPRDDDQVLKLQLSRVGFGQPGRGWQIGTRVRLDGDQPEYSLVVGRWRMGVPQ